MRARILSPIQEEIVRLIASILFVVFSLLGIYECDNERKKVTPIIYCTGGSTQIWVRGDVVGCQMPH